MSDLVALTRVYGLPVAQGRPRAFRLPTGQIRMYDPIRSREWKRAVALRVSQQKPASGAWPVAGDVPLDLRLDFFMPIPKSMPKKQAQHGHAHTSRPDVDNLTKSVLDALRGVVYTDDAQVWSLTARKLYGAEPGVAIVVKAVH